MSDILDFNVGLTLGILNEKTNQIIDLKNRDNGEEEVIEGNAEMLINM